MRGAIHEPDSLRYPASVYLVAGELDLATERWLEEMLADALDDHGPVTLDMSAVTFVDSTAVAAIVRAMRRAGDGCLIIHGARRSVRRTLELLGIERVQGIHVTPCDRDPFPGGRALLGSDGDGEVARKLTEMATAFRKKQARLATLEARTRDATDRARTGHAQARAVRERARRVRLAGAPLGIASGAA